MEATKKYILGRRIDEGLSSKEQVDKLYAKAKQKEHIRRRNARIKFVRESRAATWEKLERSSLMAKKVLEVYPYQGELEHEWCDQFLKLLEEAEEIVNQRKYEERMPEKYLFWYDCSYEIRLAAKDLVDNFPRGASLSPLTIL